MPVEIVALYVVVVVLPIACPRVVRRVDVDRVYGPLVSEGELLQDVEIFAVDNSVEGLIAATSDLTVRAQARIDAITELGYEKEIIEWRRGGLDVLAGGC